MRLALAVAMVVGTGVGAAPGPFDHSATLAQSTRTQWDGIFSKAQANRGAALFEAHCIVCHGGGLAPDLIGAGFNAGWDGSSIGELFSLVQTAMPQQEPGSLTPQQYIDVVAHVLNSGGFPAGQDALQPEVNTLNQITFVATRPAAAHSGAHDVTPMPDDVFERLFRRMLGTWEFKADKSNYITGGPPRRWVVIYERAGDRTVTYTNETVAADGQASRGVSTQVLDGDDHRRPNSDRTIARLPVDENTITATLKNAGRVTSRNTQIFSADGQRMTIIARSVDEQGGERITAVYVYDKVN